MKVFGIKKTEYRYFDNDLDGKFDFFDVCFDNGDLEYVGIKKVEKSIAERICDADLGDDFNDISAKEQAERIAEVAIERGLYNEKYFEWGKITKEILDAAFFDPRYARKYAQVNGLKEFEVFEFKGFGEDPLPKF